MKRFFFYILILIGSICIISCSNEELDVRLGKQVPITFLLNLGGEQTTRTISDGTSVDQLVYSVISDKGETIIPRTLKNRVSGLAANGEMTITISLPSGCNYKAIFWLQSSECTAYSISNDMKVTVDYHGPNNDELRDAFWGVSDSFTVEENEVVSVVLKRPFAQVNAATFPFDWEYVRDFHKFNAIKSSAVIRGVPNEINLLDGVVSGSVDASFTPGDMPTEKLYTDVDENGVNEEYTYLSMSYVLADTEPTKHSATLFFINDKGETVLLNDSRLDAISIQRNQRNDFVGQVLSKDGELNVMTYNDNGNTEMGNVYYLAEDNLTIENTVFNLSNHSAAIQFDSNDGELITYNNLMFTGSIWCMELGKYRNASYVNYNNVLNNVVTHNLSVSCSLECHEWYFSPAIIAYGNTELNNCVMKGTTSIVKTVTDDHGITHDVIPVDIGVRNESDAVINGGEYGTVFAWTHSVVDIFDAHIDTLYCGTCDSTNHSWMTIGAGTTINKVICCEPRCPYGGKEYSTTMTIKSGATVGSLQLVSTDVEFLIIEDGANVGPITCEGVEYTYQELREAMGL